jgi:hypothetical protein
MIEALVAALSLGIDGFVACAAIGLLEQNARGSWSFRAIQTPGDSAFGHRAPGGAIAQRLPLVAWFGVCDGLGLLAGHAMHLSPAWGAAWEPAMAALWTMLALLLIVTRSRPLLYLLPVLLAFDNFVAGTATTQAALPLDAVLSCLASATMAAAGLFVGRAGRIALLASIAGGGMRGPLA